MLSTAGHALYIGELVELRFFGGLSIEETAHVMDRSARTVKRDWRMAKAWLFREIQGRTPNLAPQVSPRVKA